VLAKGVRESLATVGVVLFDWLNGLYTSIARADMSIADRPFGSFQ
jgi:hypothetical protein